MRNRRRPKKNEIKETTKSHFVVQWRPTPKRGFGLGNMCQSIEHTEKTQTELVARTHLSSECAGAAAKTCLACQLANQKRGLISSFWAGQLVMTSVHTEQFIPYPPAGGASQFLV